MTLTKQAVIDQITVREFGHIEVRQATRILEDGVELSRTYHRHVLAPGDDLTGQDARVSTIATALWTPEVVEAYKAALAKNKL